MTRVTEQFREKPPRARARRWSRRELIRRRAAYLQGDFIGIDPASLAQEPRDPELEREVRSRLADAGARWAARARGIL